MPPKIIFKTAKASNEVVTVENKVTNIIDVKPKTSKANKKIAEAAESAAIADKYKKLDAREHVLTRPGMYIGSIEEDIYDTWVFDKETGKMIKKQIKYIPGLFKIFDEILVNAVDHSIRLKCEKEKGKEVNLVKNIKVSIDKETGVFEVTNDGDGIEIVKHPEHDIYIPELIFGNMLTSTNYDDTQEKIIGGTNGLGSKLTSIFSTFFEVETIDHSRKLQYIQRFENNMSVTLPAKITKCTKKPYTIIRFKPDYDRFNMKSGLTDDMYNIISKRVYDACAVTDNDVTIHFNGEKLDIKTFEKYVDLFIGAKGDHNRVYEKINDRWEIVASYNDFNGFEQVSFVNGIWTIRGGKHVEFILNQIVKKLSDLITKKNKNVTIKPQSIKDNLILFVKSTITNPTFDSQSKETLTTPSTKFGGTKAEVSDKFIEKLYKSGIVEKILELSQMHDTKTLQKTDGKKRNIIKGLPKLEDANWAGTNKSKECVLILTEGDSAATMAIAGISEVGRERYGVFPLRGKVLNVQDTNAKKISDNEEITNIKKILGLETKEYKNIDDLRYGSVMLLTDQDKDGSHIKGLLFNLFNTMWPSLLKMNVFITSMLTPIVKVRKQNNSISFYSITDFENWYNDHKNESGWTIKYYKGLGTSDTKEAKEYFKEMKKVKYIWNDKPSEECLDLAFNKKRADDRKDWLTKYDRQNILDYTISEVTYDDFVNKDLIHFSNYDVERSIPSMLDGLKISQRKVLYGCFKRNLTDKEMKVAQLASYVSEISAYHHGEASLQTTIIGMAQNFVGANNINLLQPRGQLGSRIHGGKDASQPRYIFTLLSELTQKIFIKDDLNILTYINDDGIFVEPYHYIPIIPMILVNGALGIGTGFSTNIPCYNPKDIISILIRLLNDETLDETIELVPWYRGFTGRIEKIADKYYSRGKFTKLTTTKIEITELPIGTWTFDFKCTLEELLDKYPNEFKTYESNSGDETVSFTIQFASSTVLDEYLKIEQNGFTKLENVLKLYTSKPLSTTNMYAFNEKGTIQKYDSPLHIISEFYKIRLEYYQKRKDYVLDKLKYDLELLENKIRFIKAVVNEEIIIHKMKKNDLEILLSTQNYKKHNDSYDYIIKIPVYNLTIDKVDDLENEYSKAKNQYDELFSKDIKEMWRDELNILSNSLGEITFEKTKVVTNKKKTVKKFDS